MRKWIWVMGITIVFVGLAFVIILNWSGTGFRGKTLWDWLSVLAIPAAVGVGTLWFTVKQAQVINAGNTDNQREAALQIYIDKMSELLLVNNLSQPTEKNEVRGIARVRTLAVLRQLDPARKANVLQFLVEARLLEDGGVVNLGGAKLDFVNLNYAPLYGINLNATNLSHAQLKHTKLGGTSLIGAYFVGANLYEADLCQANLNEAILCRTKLRKGNLSHADLSRADLRWADLNAANLNEANLKGANLRGANLNGVDLNGADLSGANLEWTTLARVDLRGANLSGAKGITDQQLRSVLSLKGATMPDGSKHP